MEGARRGKFLLLCFLLAVLVTQSLVTLVKCRSLEEFADQKNYYSPDPHVGSSPPHVVSPPKHSHESPSCSPPPYTDPGCTPSHGSCGSHGIPPTPSHGGSSGTPTPPSQGGGGGYYNSPPTIPTIPPPSPDVVPVTPTPTIPIVPPTPTTPIISTPPSPPFILDPNVPPSTPGGTCNYWSTNPAAIWGIFGYWATIGQLFGPATTFPFRRNLSVQEALVNTRSDGIGALYREGTAAFLNSLVNKKFPFTTQQVRHAFASALVSEKVAAAQARLFKLANEGQLK